MQPTKTTPLLLTLIAFTLAQDTPAPQIENGDAVIVNKCAFPVFYVSVGNTSGLVHTIPPGGMYREKFQLRYLRNNHLGFKKYSGISIKLSPNQSISTAVSKKSTFDESTVTQFEYTYDPSRAPGLWYDISNVNGYIFNDVLGWNGILPWPFEEDGLILESTSSNCPSVICPGGNPSGNSTCTQAFTHPKDNWATHGCGNNETLVLTLCTLTSAMKEVTGPPSSSHRVQIHNGCSTS